MNDRQYLCGFGLRHANFVAIAAFVLSLFAPALIAQSQAFKGAIIDSMCAGPKGHTAMLKPGETMAECTENCVKAGAKYVLYNPQTKTVYQLNDQLKPKAFAGRTVLILGTLDQPSSTLHISEMFPGLPAKVTAAKSVYVDCDTCVRGMAKAGQAAINALTDWKRFTVVQDEQKADLVLLFSANPYQGDYVTRKGPDTRPVRVLVTYLSVVDPHTGVSYWNDSSESGSWRVAGATKNLINRLRGRMEAEDGHITRLMKLDANPVSVTSSDSAVIK